MCRHTVSFLALRVCKEKLVLGHSVDNYYQTNQQSNVPEKESDLMKKGGKPIRYQAKISPALISRCTGNLDRDPRMISGPKIRVALRRKCRSPIAGS